MSKITIKMDDKVFSAFVPKAYATAHFLNLCRSAIWNPQGTETESDEEMQEFMKKQDATAIDCEEKKTKNTPSDDEPTDAIPQVSHGKDIKKEKPEQYKGFLHLICDNCKKVIVINAKKPISEFTCHACGHTSQLENLAPVRLTCECGKKWRYQTNSYAELLEINCISCNSPIVAQLNKDGEYETLKN